MLRLLVAAILIPAAVGIAGPKTVLPDDALVITLRPHEEDNCSIWVLRKTIPPGDFAKLQTVLVAMRFDADENPDGLYRPTDTILIKPHADLPWKFVAQGLQAIADAGYANVVFEPVGRGGDGSLGMAAPKPGKDSAKVDGLADLKLPTDQVVSLERPADEGALVLPSPKDLARRPHDLGQVFDVKADDRRIVYVIDASGSMIETLPFAIEAVRRSIEQLSDEQHFDIIFFQRDTVVRVQAPKVGLKKADPATIKAASDWMNLESSHVQPRVILNPVPGLTAAIALKPDAVFLLSDGLPVKGQYAIDEAKLLNDIAKLFESQHAANVRLNTVQFIYPDKRQLLKKLAEQHNGTYRYVDASALRR